MQSSNYVMTKMFESNCSEPIPDNFSIIRGSQEYPCILHECFSRMMIIPDAPDCEFTRKTTIERRRSVAATAYRCYYNIPIVILPMHNNDKDIFTEFKIILNSKFTLDESLALIKKQINKKTGLFKNITGCRLGSKTNVDIFTHQDLSCIDIKTLRMEDIYERCKCITDGILYMYMSTSDDTFSMDDCPITDKRVLPPPRGHYNINYLMRHLDFECGIKLEKADLVYFLAQRGYAPKPEYDTENVSFDTVCH